MMFQKKAQESCPFSKNIYIERDDFNANPPKDYFRLTPEQPVRLKHAYIISFKELIKDASGNIIEIKVNYHSDSKSGVDTSGIKVKSAIQWVSAKECKKVEVRLYNRLFLVENPEGIKDINPNSLQIIKNALIEPAVINERPDERFQFERQGYFYADPIDYTEQNPVFNKIVALKDSWTKKTKTTKTKTNKIQIDGEASPMNEGQNKAFNKYCKELKLNHELANILARDEQLSHFFENSLSLLNSPITLANMVANDVARELKQTSKLKFTPKQIAELVGMIDDGTISNKIAKQVFEEMAKSGENPSTIVESKGLVQISDPSKLSPIIDEIIAKNPTNVAKFKEGNTKLLGFFVGQVLKTTGGKANPKVVNELVAKKLNE